MTMSARRAPGPEERRRDPDRSRQALLDAARHEFADKGLAGARVSEIAERAGLNKQLISYYFGGKQGLYDTLVEQWLEQERAMADPAVGLDEIVARYLAVAHTQPELQRLFIRENLEADHATVTPELDADDVNELRRRQAEGEIDPEIDPAFLLIVLQAAVSIGVLFPRDVRRYLDMDPSSDEFFEHADRQLRILVQHLATPPGEDAGRSRRRPPGTRTPTGEAPTGQAPTAQRKR
jgi:TetR/AcrR family transcriptional regulator